MPKTHKRRTFGAASRLVIAFAASCSVENAGENAGSDEAHECQASGDVAPCVCADGKAGQKTCLPSQVYSFCDCEIGAGVAGDDRGGAGGAGMMAGMGGAAGAAGASPTSGSGGGDQAGSAGVDAAAGSSAQSGSGGGEAGADAAGQGGSGGNAVPPTDCDNLPALPILEVNVLAHVPAVEDFTFDSIGNLVAISTSNELFRCPYSGTPQVVLPNVSPSMGSGIVVRGTRFLDADNIVFADLDNSLVRLDLTDLSKDTLLNGLVGPNGVAVGMNGLVYLTEMGGRVREVDPGTKTTRVLFEQAGSFDGITFNADYSRLYFNSESGSVSYLPFNADGTTGEHVPVSPNVAILLDGMAADECGNVYVVQMAGIIHRLTPDGQQQEVVDLNDLVGSYEERGLVNAVNFGSGIGGWKADALYIASMEGSAYEVVVGVKGAPQPHLP